MWWPSHHQASVGGRLLVLLAAGLAVAFLPSLLVLDQFGHHVPAHFETHLETLLPPPASKSVDPEAAAVVVRELLRLGDAGPSRRGNKHRSVVCSMTRNDVHLREFVVRSLLAGAGHMVIYDNNRVEEGMDMDVRDMLAPFVAAGAVTHIPSEQNGTTVHRKSVEKEIVMADCAKQSAADWVMVFDSDEMIYMEERMEDGEGGRRVIGVLSRFLEALEDRAPRVCSMHFPWRMMYGEHRTTTTPNQLLMDAYPRVCKHSWLPKLIFRPDWVGSMGGLPHGVTCNNPGGAQLGSDDAEAVALLPEYLPHSHLQHYYQKSVELWIPKLEQSWIEYIRYFPVSYDGDRSCAEGKKPAAIDPAYAEQVRAFMARLRAADPATPDGGQRLGRMPELGREAFDRPEAGGPTAYELYLFMKVRVGQREEWDEERYLADHPEVAEGVAKGEWVDGFQHFLVEGFASMNGTDEAAGYFVRSKS